jgi:hypothetical protein
MLLAGFASTQMDDQQGQFIDGTARAQQWRRSRSQAARTDEDAPAARSDAPKSFAGSLLVPADMLGETGPPEHPDDGGAHHEDTEPSTSAPTGEPQTAGASAGPVVQPNPFLVAGAAAARAARHRSRPGHTRAIIGWANTFRARQAWSRAGRPPAGRRAVWRAVRFAGVVSVVLASGAVALTVLMRRSSPTNTPPAHIEALGASVTSSNPLETRPLPAAETTHVARQRPADAQRSHRVRSVRARHSSHTHRRSRSSARKPTPARVHYQPPASSAPDVPASAPQTTGATNSVSSQPSAPTTNNVAPSSPPASTDRSTSSSSQHQPVFGANGSLGPGSSPDG